ncbi:PIR protein [Plasmodium ovale]|uniref:PIR protein n=1 Tax=Plasmodium ovale TaxID=36330 RepID=A0A1D3JC05_PLAOA|nr:PIR protein [Plasmodium ovale]
MTRTKVTGKEIYAFCRNSPYYQMLVENINGEIDVQKEVDVKKKNDMEKIKSACNSFSYDVCSLEKSSGKEICTKFFCMYRFLNEAYRKQNPDSILTYEDFDFLNYWLNVKLNGKNNDNTICISNFDKEMGSQVEFFNHSKTKLEKHLHVIDPDNLENMELLFELYNNERNILNMMKIQNYSNDEHKTCLYYTEKSHETYKKAMDKCLNYNADYYKALKDFKISYIGIEKENEDLKNCKSSPYFYLTNYDPVLEKQRNIMAGKILSAPLILSFVIPLLYKYTPFGPFLRAKTKMIKNMWMNPDKNESELLLSSTDIEDNISDNGEYNIGYYSGKD